jgi:hypothetical protein
VLFAVGDQAVKDRARDETPCRSPRLRHQRRRRDPPAGSRAQLTTTKRTIADVCATYSTNKAPHLDNSTALAAGWPIATELIEGISRYLVANRIGSHRGVMERRWLRNCPEPRVTRANGEFANDWTFHLDHER